MFDMEEKNFNITVVYTDGRSKSATNVKATSKSEAIKKEIEDAIAWKEDILSITIIESSR
jgi:hypothetical protein